MKRGGFSNPYGRLGIITAVLFVTSCDSAPVYTDLRIYDSPYDGVDWNSVQRLKAQHHDHIGTNSDGVRAYDTAGYEVLSLMAYSGNRSVPHAWTERLWPPENWIAESVLNSLVNIRFFIPNAEEVGLPQHATSPFLTRYIEGVAMSMTPDPISQYRSIQEMFSVVRKNDGYPCLAHPWHFNYEYLDGSFCAEIFTAFAAARQFQGYSAFVNTDQNLRLLARWDRALGRNQRVFGIAVNDHFGPYNLNVPPEIRDSGKIIVLADDVSPAAYRNAFQSGRFFAVQDMGTIKDQYPNVFNITIDRNSIYIEATGIVRWISHGITIGNDAELPRADLLPNATYVRAEIANGYDGSIVYTQAFVVRPVGDIDGDYDIDNQDEQICQDVVSGVETDALRIAACGAVDE